MQIEHIQWRLSNAAQQGCAAFGVLRSKLSKRMRKLTGNTVCFTQAGSFQIGVCFATRIVIQ